MSALRRPVVAALTFLFVALLSAFVWSEPRPPHSFRVEVTGRGRPMILTPGLASSGDTWKRGFDGQSDSRSELWTPAF